MIDLNGITRPTLLLDEDKCRKNIKMMAEKARSSNVIFRPHFKTHQSLTIGNWFSDEGVNAITVSSVTMAGHFAENGWKDITVAFPANRRELEEMKKISKKASLNILISSPDQLSLIKDNIRFTAGCFVKINAGLNRSGTDWNDHPQLLRMIEETGRSNHLRFMGFLTHSGNTYEAASDAGIVEIYKEALFRMTSLRSLTAGKKILSVGDTPSCSIIDNFAGVDEIRPGNFVFYDLTQSHLGSCNKTKIAICVACPIVDKNIKRKEIIIYGGGVHLSKDRINLNDGRTVFGLAVNLTAEGWDFPDKDAYIRSLSQEHGIISAPVNFFNSVKIGDLIGVLPVHSCMTADLMRHYHTFDGKIIKDFSPK